MVDIQHASLTGDTQLHPPLAKNFTGDAAIYTPDNANELVVKTDVTPHVLYRTTGVLAGDVIQIGSVSIESQDEGGTLTSATTTFNFVGAGVTATEASGIVTITVPGGGGSAIEVEDEGVSLTTGVTKFNFIGEGVTATEPIADEITVTVPGNPLEVSDEGISLTTAAVELDFVGTGVTTTESAGVVTVTIPGGGSALEIEDEGVSLSTTVSKINFAGTGVTATEPVADEILVTIPGGGGSPITVQDEGLSLTTNVGQFNFVGAGVTATEPIANEITVTIPGNQLEVEDEAVSLSTAVTKINFTGAGVTATEPITDEILVTIPGGTSGLEIEDEGVSLSTGVSKINFAGAGVTATEPVTNEILVTIPGGGGGGSAALTFTDSEELTTTSTQVQFSTLTSESYLLKGQFKTSTTDYLLISINNDQTASEYTNQVLAIQGVAIAGDATLNTGFRGAFFQTGSTAKSNFEVKIDIDDDGRVYLQGNAYAQRTSGTNRQQFTLSGRKNTTEASITSIEIFPGGGGNIEAGSNFYLYSLARS